MEELLKKFVGKEIDVAYGVNNIVRGNVTEVRDGILILKDEDERSVFIAIDKITVVWEVSEPHLRPGFVV